MLIPNATNFVISPYLRRSYIDKSTTLNIITFCTHERYEQNLSKTGHNFYALKVGKTWNSDCGIQPDNYHQMSQLPEHIDYDLVLCQDGGRYDQAKQIANLYNVPLIMLTHVLPDVRYSEDRQRLHMQHNIKADKHIFISEYNRQKWGMDDREDTSVIHHGIDFNFWSDGVEQVKREERVLSVANKFPERDWCLGWEIWKDIIGFTPTEGSFTADYPVELVGDNPPYSKPASSLQSLRKKYQESRIFLNTSLHSPVPMSLMEAMACGCIVVSTETCMIPEIIENSIDGITSNNPDEIRLHIEAILDDPEQYDYMAKNAMSEIETNYNLEKFVEKWNDAFYEVIKNYESILLA